MSIESRDPIQHEGDYADTVVDILQEEMPGFKANLRAATDRIEWRGPFWLNGWSNRPAYVMPVPNMEQYARAMAREIIVRTRQHGIEQLGLQATIDEIAERARDAGRRVGYSEGHAAGIAVGRKEMLAEILAAGSEEDDDDPRD